MLVFILVPILDRIVVRQRLAGVARWNEDLKLLIQHMAPRYELLDASTADRLTDEQIANVLTYVRNSWGNSGEAVGPQDVAKIRQEIPAPPAQAKNSFE